MLVHFVSLLVQVWAAFTTSLGNTTLGFLLPTMVVPLAGFLLAIGVILWREGKDALVTHLRKTLGLAAMIAIAGEFMVYGSALAITLVKTVYHDHTFNVGVAADLRSKLSRQQALDESHFAPVKDTLTAQLTTLSQKCSKQEGIAETLDKQNRGQQEIINNCQTQALKLLTPEAFKMTPFILNEDTVKDAQTVKFLVLTNQVVTPIKMRISCDRELVTASVWILGSGTMAGGGGVTPPNFIDVGIDSPAWSPISPMVITATYRGQLGIACRFQRR